MPLFDKNVDMQHDRRHHCLVIFDKDKIIWQIPAEQINHAKELPGKFKMAVSGCHLSCAESWVRDIGLIGKKDGWTVVIGGNVGAEPRIAQEIVSGLDDAGVLQAIDKLVQNLWNKPWPMGGHGL